MYVSLLSTLIILLSIKESHQFYKQFNLDNSKLCSPITKRKLIYGGIIVKESKTINQHSLEWVANNRCKFEIKSVHPFGGVVAVVQSLNLRKNYLTGECIDYVEFSTKKQAPVRVCGSLSDSMSNTEFHPNNLTNSFIAPRGELDVIIFINKTPLQSKEKTELLLVFTSYMECDITNPKFKPCNLSDSSICIEKKYFNDGYINCPGPKCIDEGNCTDFPAYNKINIQHEDASTKLAAERRVVAGLLITVFLSFFAFSVIVWSCKKLKSCCWSHEFAHPESISESVTSVDNTQIHIIEMNNTPVANVPNAPSVATEADVTPAYESVIEPQGGKDSPPSYDDLFPNTK